MLVTGLIWQRKNNPEVSFPEQNIIRLATISIGCKQTLWLKGGLAHQGCCWTTRGLWSFSPWTEASPFWPLSRQSLPRTKKKTDTARRCQKTDVLVAVSPPQLKTVHRARVVTVKQEGRHRKSDSHKNQSESSCERTLVLRLLGVVGLKIAVLHLCGPLCKHVWKESV